MKRRLLIALFAVGTVVGFGAGFAHLLGCAHHARWHCHDAKHAPDKH